MTAAAVSASAKAPARVRLRPTMQSDLDFVLSLEQYLSGVKDPKDKVRKTSKSHHTMLLPLTSINPFLLLSLCASIFAPA